MTYSRGIWAAALSVWMLVSVGADDKGCKSEPSSSVDQNSIRQVYWVLYDEDADLTYIRGQFRFGSALGTTLMLTDGASVSFNGMPMAFDALLDWYQVVVAGKVTSGEILYRNTDAEEFRIPIQPYAESTLPLDFPKVLSLSQSHVVNWDGPAVGPSDTVEITVARETNRLDFQLFATQNEGATQIVLDSARLSKIGVTNAAVTLRHWRRYELTGAPSDSHIKMTYQAGETSVMLQ